MTRPLMQSIDCTEARRRLWDYLDGELSEMRAAEMRAHLEVCRHCFNVVELERILLERIAASRSQVAAPSEVRERVIKALEEAGLSPE